jgi:hypothetical protein
VADPKPPEMQTTQSPADVAAKDAIALQLRLKEMEHAEQLTRQAQQQPPHAAEPPPQQPQQPAMPAHIEKWLSEHPQYMDPNDPVSQAEIYTATLKCNRDGKMWDQPDFLPTLERHLGLRREQPAQPQPQPQQPQPQPPRYEAPPRQQQRSSVIMSAPPTREVPSMASGRVPSHRVPLTAEQRDAARFSGISEQEYERQLRKMEAMKAAGALDDRR